MGDTLMNNDLLNEIIFVSSDNDYNNNDKVISAAEGTCIALSSCSIGELYAKNNNKNNNKDVLIIIDTIHPFKILWDYTTQYVLSMEKQKQDITKKKKKKKKKKKSTLGWYHC